MRERDKKREKLESKRDEGGGNKKDTTSESTKEVNKTINIVYRIFEHHHRLALLHVVENRSLKWKQRRKEYMNMKRLSKIIFG